VYPTIEPISSDEDAQRIADLENHVKILKQQAITALDMVKKFAELESKILSLEEQVLMQSSRITHMTKRDHYMNEHLERAGEQLECKFLGAPSIFPLSYMLM
jgi:hypothetical protein